MQQFWKNNWLCSRWSPL